jgi:hypothetical protein
MADAITPRAAALLYPQPLQLSRALAGGFPDNPDYRSLLTALEKLRPQHFP